MFWAVSNGFQLVLRRLSKTARLLEVCNIVVGALGIESEDLYNMESIFDERVVEAVQSTIFYAA